MTKLISPSLPRALRSEYPSPSGYPPAHLFHLFQPMLHRLDGLTTALAS